jgi:hypothetical protein
MRHSAIWSLVALCVAVTTIMVVDGNNDRELIRTQVAAAQKDCEIAASSTVATRSAFLRLAQAVPGYPPVAIDFVEWVRRCLVVQDCRDLKAEPIELDDDCSVAPPVVSVPPPGG